jgi:hypothetical protein
MIDFIIEGRKKRMDALDILGALDMFTEKTNEALR